jgi:hypothetical protein
MVQFNQKTRNGQVTLSVATERIGCWGITELIMIRGNRSSQW